MIYQLTVPGLVADVEEIRVLEWHGAPLKKFAPGDMIVELETHKALVEVRAGQAGVLRQIFTPDGEWQKIGAALCLFSDDEREALPADVATAKGLIVEFEIN